VAFDSELRRSILPWHDRRPPARSPLPPAPAAAAVVVEIPVGRSEQRVLKVPKRSRNPLLVPPRVAGQPEKHRPLVIVDAMHLPSEGVEVTGHLAADQARGASYEHLLVMAYLMTLLLR
jgi:hypothetical protein